MLCMNLLVREKIEIIWIIIKIIFLSILFFRSNTKSAPQVPAFARIWLVFGSFTSTTRCKNKNQMRAPVHNLQKSPLRSSCWGSFVTPTYEKCQKMVGWSDEGTPTQPTFENYAQALNAFKAKAKTKGKNYQALSKGNLCPRCLRFQYA